MKETIFLKGEGLKNIESYDFSALKKVLKIDRNKLVKEIKNSGLKGRGGAGFPTGLKWEIALNKNADNKYFICNADEGEPGTFKDRYLLENRPLKVLEGILIGAYAVGANEGYIYIRGEYANPINIFKKIIKDARKLRVLGEDIFNSGFNFDLHLVKGAGAYVCGDETSLINSIEGERGRSRLTPPYPIDNGLFGKPTVVNNVETLAACAEIIEQGSEKYASLGTDKSKGTKLICLSGDVNEPGVYELEFGSLTLKEIIYDLGKGVKDNKEIYPGIFLTGEVPRTNDFETKSKKYTIKIDEKIQIDTFRDDETLFIETNKGLVLLLGCSHSGIVNIIEYIKKLKGNDKIYAIIGGMHLINAGEDRIKQTISYLKKINFELLIPLHCTGFNAVRQMKNEFGDRVNVAHTGDRFIF